MVNSFRYIPCLLLLLSQPAFSRTPAETNQQITANRAVREVALSPDGQMVASVITDATAAGGRSHLWILSQQSRPKQVTGNGADDPTDDSSPTWTPDGRKLLYIERKGASAAIRQVDPASGQTDSLGLSRDRSNATGGWGASPGGTPVVVKGFALAATGTVAVWAADGAGDADQTRRKDDHHPFEDGRKVRLYLIDDHRAPREVSLPHDVRTAAWSNDGRRLLVITQQASDDLGIPNQLWLIEAGKSPSEVRGTAENIQSMSWLPDGRIAYIARCVRNAPTVCRDVFVQGLDGSTPRDLTAGIDGSVMTDGPAAGPVVTGDGDVLVTVARRFDQQIARIRPGDGRITWIGAFPAVVRALATNASRSGYAMMAAERGGVVSVQIADADLRRYSRLDTPELQSAAWSPLRARRLQWTSDKLAIDGLLYVPDGATKDRPVPLVTAVHGGPAGRFEDSDYPLVRLLLEQGWAVLLVNPRGSFGYGTQFLAAVQDDLGGGDYRDIMAGIDAALAQAPLDRERLAMIGFSYGGTMTGFALGRTDRFRALVSAAPVTDQFSEYGTEDSSWYDRWYFGQPWRRFEAAWRQSPLSGVANARTPFLLLQGEGDVVDPPGQSIELYRALRQEGAPVEFILFPRESHRELGQNFFGYPSIEPHHGVALRQRMLDFLSAAFAGQPNAGLATGGRP